MSQKPMTTDTLSEAETLVPLPDGRMLSFSVYGPEDGIPWVLHHGTPGSRISTDESIYYELGIQVICPERPGYGRSSPNPQASYASWVKDVVSLLDFLGLESVHVGGVSGGGAFAAACASMASERFRSLSLMASVAPPETEQDRTGMARANRWGFWALKYMPWLAKWGSNQFAKNLLKDPEAVLAQMNRQLCEADQQIMERLRATGEMEFLVEHLKEAFRQGAAGHIKDMNLLANPWNLPLNRIECPVHVWHGTEDTLSPIQGAHAWKRLLPDANLRVKSGAGHLLMEEHALQAEILQQLVDP
ncbi:alpha/beta hydrolase [Pontibacter sp. G13]|uniref:alpha/beta fold hydrolase n=1 Tax=Pontibacter sp. G13 TaxID=3074898 RepID=UPI00288BC7F7|nr:alpha/beta hydrolase [Pontibacter sp. G13]WNJ19026.1 alpha/beta hydrolase [Pontibacter sp. G13]